MKFCMSKVVLTRISFSVLKRQLFSLKMKVILFCLLLGIFPDIFRDKVMDDDRQN